MTNLTLAREQYEAKHAAAEQARAAAAVASREEREAELALIEFEGRGSTPHAEWIRCWLNGDTDGCDYWLAQQYPATQRERAEKMLKIVRAIPLESGVEAANG